MMWNDHPSWIGNWNHGNLMIKAWRDPSIECVVAQHPWLEHDCLFADIILPINTVWKRGISRRVERRRLRHRVCRRAGHPPVGVSPITKRWRWREAKNENTPAEKQSMKKYAPPMKIGVADMSGRIE
jgi:anaerobic selenocysteine-containing dehydrogenase